MFWYANVCLFCRRCSVKNLSEMFYHLLRCCDNISFEILYLCTSLLEITRQLSIAFLGSVALLHFLLALLTSSSVYFLLTASYLVFTSPLASAYALFASADPNLVLLFLSCSFFCFRSIFCSVVLVTHGLCCLSIFPRSSCSLPDIPDLRHMFLDWWVWGVL